MEQVRAFLEVSSSRERGTEWEMPKGESTRVGAVAVSRAVKEVLAENPHLLHSLHHRDFEYLVASLLEDTGFEEVAVTPGSRDGGVDIVAVRHNALGPLLYLVECKRYSRAHKVGVEPVRQLYAVKNVMHASAAALVTTSFFTSGAKSFAQKVGYELALHDYDSLVSLLMNFGAVDSGC